MIDFDDALDERRVSAELNTLTHLRQSPQPRVAASVAASVDAQDESRDSATAYAVAATADGGAIWAGTTSGLWGVQSAGSYDFIASKLDADGSLIWTWQVIRFWPLQPCQHESTVSRRLQCSNPRPIQMMSDASVP